MIFRNQESVRLKRKADERVLLVYLEFGGKTGAVPALDGGMDRPDPAGRVSAGAARVSRKLSENLGIRLDSFPGFAPGGTLRRAQNTGAL